jgi:hypothetical protein
MSDPGSTDAPEMERAAEFTAGLLETFGDAVVAVLLYGSAARGEYRSATSDLNLLVVLKDLELVQLTRAATLTRGWVESGNPPPLLMSAEEWWSSADVFPIEYTDIRDAHRVLHGVDPFAKMRIRREHLRLQLEHEIRSKKIQLREGILVGASDPSLMGRLLLSSVATLLTIFRATRRLAGMPVPASARDLVDTVAAEAGFRASAVHEVMNARSDPAAFEPDPSGSVVAGYLEAWERTARWLDRYRPDAQASEDV